RLGVDQTPFSTDLGRLQGEGKTVVVLGTRNRVLALIAIADQTRAGSSSVMKALRQEGIRELVLLTGDNQATARTVGSALGIGNVKAELLPGQKLDAIKRLRKEYGSVAMVGEGVNDAPALAAADVGIAMGAAGTDTALETADIALMNDDLAKLPYTLRLSRRTLRIIKENIIFAITVKAVFILLTVLGLSTLWMAVFADTGAALIVIANSMRLLGGQHTKARGPSPGLARAA
ncbi:MAG: HAD-IC family P-type ATPase, partial [Eubacteriales bacterium]|nr:HAD-IC family P-type ATPase [Eubacteriales bacterium]